MSTTNKIFYLNYGKTKVSLSICPPGKLDILENSNDQIKPLDVLEIERIIKQPLISYLENKRKLLLIVPDKTRKSRLDILLPLVLKYSKIAGIAESNTTILFANGTHSPLTKEEQRNLIGAEYLDRYKTLNHNAKSDDAILIGTTKRGTPVRVNPLVENFDGIITVSAVMHHYFAGFGGGPKMLVPGIAHEETVLANHKLTLTEEGNFNNRCVEGVLDNNPVYEDIVDALKFCPSTLYIGVIINKNDEIIYTDCGDVIQTHKKLSALASITFENKINQLYDLVIVSPGGYPRDITFIQTHKSIHRAFAAVKKNGVIFCLAECIEGIGSESFLQWFNYNSSFELANKLKNNYTLNGHTALAFKNKTEKCKIILFSSLENNLVRDIGLFSVSNLQDGLELARKYLPRLYDTLIIPHGAVTITKTYS